MTINQWLHDRGEELNRRGIVNGHRDAEIILSHVMQKDRSFFLAHTEEELTEPEQQQANLLLKRRAEHEPMAYIIGQKEFFGLPFKTDVRGLIPRWETELIIEKALEWLSKQEGQRIIADIGTGVGTIVCTLADRYPFHRYYATDISKNVLTLAQENAATLALTNITFLHGNLAEPLFEARLTHKINLVTANLPYIKSDLLTKLDPTIKFFEPDIALNGGNDGLELYRQCIPQLKELVASEGYLLFEHEFDQGLSLHQIIQNTFHDAVIETHKDHLGHDRVTSVTPRATGEEDDDID
jgi:release factor glutamine methyltransferase